METGIIVFIFLICNIVFVVAGIFLIFFFTLNFLLASACRRTTAPNKMLLMLVVANDGLFSVQTQVELK